MIMDSNTIAGHLQFALDVAEANVLNGGGPFGAVIVLPSGKTFVGVNRVTKNLDPTAHAEVTAIRKACEGVQNFSLEGATLFSSCEPCPMCLTACLWARIDKVYFAASRYDAADAGFDDLAFYEQIENGATGDYASAYDLSVATRTAPFERWTNTETVVSY